MQSLWADENKFKTWFLVEMAVVRAYEAAGHVPEGTSRLLDEKAETVDWQSFPASVLEKEQVTKHDVIAFLSALEEYLGDSSRYIHLGLTSSDVVDTAFALLLCESGNQIIKQANNLLQAFEEKAEQYRNTLCLGRTHGQAAEITTFGLKLLTFVSELKRSIVRIEDAVANISFGKLSGAVGNYSNISPQIEAAALESLGLKPEPVATQVIPRDRHAQFFSSLSIMAGFIERFSIEIRHLMRSEVAEVSEPFSKGQKGSSAMPHKKNPILTENMTGLARLVRNYANTAFENQALWHERDISHSSVERVIAPDATTLVDFALKRLNSVVRGLVVNEDNMAKNLSLVGDLVYSQHILSALVSAGVMRQEAYAWVQEAAFESRAGKPFVTALGQHEKIANVLPESTILSLVSSKHHLRHLDQLFERI